MVSRRHHRGAREEHFPGFVKCFCLPSQVSVIASVKMGDLMILEVFSNLFSDFKASSRSLKNPKVPNNFV